jgi:IS30 family transposase
VVLGDCRVEARPGGGSHIEPGRSPSALSREIRRNRHPGAGDDQPYAAQRRAEDRRPRPTISKLAGCPVLHGPVRSLLDHKCGPEQISRRLRRDHPDRRQCHVSHESIYQAVYVRGRGSLRRELASALRAGRAVRRATTPDLTGEGGSCSPADPTCGEDPPANLRPEPAP